MTQSYDFYAVARSIGEWFASNGMPAEKARILDAMESGSTGTEILMALRWNLNQMSQSGQVIPDHIQQQIYQFDVELKKLGI